VVAGRGRRALGFGSNYTSHTIGWGHQLSDVIMIRPEIGYADAKAFDLGRKNYLWAGRVDGTWPG